MKTIIQIFKDCKSQYKLGKPVIFNETMILEDLRKDIPNSSFTEIPLIEFDALIKNIHSWSAYYRSILYLHHDYDNEKVYEHLTNLSDLEVLIFDIYKTSSDDSQKYSIISTFLNSLILSRYIPIEKEILNLGKQMEYAGFISQTLK